MSVLGLIEAKLHKLNPRFHSTTGNEASSYAVYLEQLPDAIHDGVDEDGVPYHECIYTPHSLRATAATELLNAGVDSMKVKELLRHRNVTTTQVYDKRRRSTAESASHEMPF